MALEVSSLVAQVLSILGRCWVGDGHLRLSVENIIGFFMMDVKGRFHLTKDAKTV